MKLKLIEWSKKHDTVIFEQELGYDSNYDNPTTFNGKLNWLKSNYRDPMMILCGGEDTVGQYAQQVLGEKGQEFLVDLVGRGVYQSVAEIDSILKTVEMTLCPVADFGAFEDNKHDAQIGNKPLLLKPKRLTRLLEIGYFR